MGLGGVTLGVVLMSTNGKTPLVHDGPSDRTTRPPDKPPDVIVPLNHPTKPQPHLPYPAAYQPSTVT